MAATGDPTPISAQTPRFVAAPEAKPAGPVTPTRIDAPTVVMPGDDAQATRFLKESAKPVALISFEWSSPAHSTQASAARFQTATPPAGFPVTAPHPQAVIQISFADQPKTAATPAVASGPPIRQPRFSPQTVSVIRNLVFDASPDSPATPATALERLLGDTERVLAQLVSLEGHGAGAHHAYVALKQTVAALRVDPQDRGAKEHLYGQLIALRECLGALPLSASFVSEPLATAFAQFTRDPGRLVQLLKSQGVANVTELQHQLGIDPPSGQLDVRTYVRMEAILLESLAVELGRDGGIAEAVAVGAVDRVQQEATFVEAMRGNTLAEAIQLGRLPDSAIHHLAERGYAIVDGQLSASATGKRLTAAETLDVGVTLLEDAAFTLAEDYDSLRRDEAVHLQALTVPERESYLLVRRNLDQLLTGGKPGNVTDAVIQAFLIELGHRQPPPASDGTAVPNPVPTDAFDAPTLERWRTDGMTSEELAKLSPASSARLMPFLTPTADGRHCLDVSPTEITAISTVQSFVVRPPSPAARQLLADVQEILGTYDLMDTAGCSPASLCAIPKADPTVDALTRLIDRIEAALDRRKRLKHRIGKPVKMGPIRKMGPFTASAVPKPEKKAAPTAVSATAQSNVVAAKAAMAAYTAHNDDQRWGAKVTANRLVQQLRNLRGMAEAQTARDAFAQAVTEAGREAAVEQRQPS